MKQLRSYLLVFLIMYLGIVGAIFAASESKQESNLLRVYEVNKKVCDFPDEEDFSTPEGTYAVVNRVMASGDEGAWRRISVKELSKKFPPTDVKRKKVKPKVAKEWLNAHILEVRIFSGIRAGVIAEILSKQGDKFYDLRFVDREGERWLNRGESVYETLDKARLSFARSCSSYLDRPCRPKKEDPKSYLKPFVKFLEERGEEPKSLVMRALSKHKLVIIGEIHHRPRYWAFNSSLVFDRDFPKYVGTIYMELPSNNQKLVEKFLATENCDTMPIIQTLRDNLWMGWPDQAMLDFFISVWMVNQDLESKQRIRIVLVDMQRPWKEINKPEDWKKYNVDRDRFMADRIIQDQREHLRDKRNALFIVGIGHTALNLKFFEGSPLKTTGWYLQKELGRDKVYAIFQHRCVMTNWGRVDGRLCLGLFDSAFAEIGNKPIAFPLKVGPFGEQQYDADPDEPVSSTYKDGFNAYLYLGPIEKEIFSPLIAGFYTDDFVKELERRHSLMFRKGWAKAYGIKESTAKNFINWMSGSGGSWGRPRKWRNQLGPIDAWKYGDNWEDEIREAKHKFAFEHPEVIKAAAKQLFDAIRNADYYSSDWPSFLPESIDYQVHHHFDSWVRWVCKTFKDNPIESVELGEVSKGRDGLPAVSYKVSLRDGRDLKGVLPFRYMPRQQFWMGVEGIDWHLQSKSNDR